ncbi:MAG: HlyD family type I secretion periplasmic adaptor subunit [Methylohalobius sp. ZOD2]|nr:HlyD family type I secretion periplasmic adaptor subunit [Methylothermaceae bacterium]
MATTRHASFLPAIPIDESGESTRIVRKAILLLAFAAIVASAWGALAPLSGAVIASGVVMVDTHRKTVQHLRGGIVKEILVREGSAVKAGQPLLALEDVASRANLHILRDQLNALLVKEARLDAERSLADAITFPSPLIDRLNDKAAKLVANEEAVFDAKRKALNEEIAMLDQAIEEAKAGEAGLISQIAAIRESISYISKRLQATEKLQKRNFVSAMDVTRVKQSLSEKKETLGEAQASLGQLREKKADLELRKITLRHEYIKAADIEYQETKKRIFEIEERLRPAEDTQKRQVVTSPIDGQVINLKVTTIGGVIKEGEPLLDIVPDNSPLIVEVKVRPQDIENVHLGQKADLQVDAYNRRTTPLLTGSVTYVSGDSLENPANHESYYLAHVEVPLDAMDKLGGLSLSPGMPVTAYLKTGERTFFEYLMSPLVDHLRKSFRES